MSGLTRAGAAGSYAPPLLYCAFYHALPGLASRLRRSSAGSDPTELVLSFSRPPEVARALCQGNYQLSMAFH